MIERKHHLDALAISLLVACCLFWGFLALCGMAAGNVLVNRRAR